MLNCQSHLIILTEQKSSNNKVAIEQFEVVDWLPSTNILLRNTMKITADNKSPIAEKKREFASSN
jgi:hypothetical protein